ncbi:reverse transcriptase-like protein [Jeotgalibacillus haloalkalitolerans]|uniref:Reverse transcriptase-like protein n=1 Tax=Jeotgalibacillus haloalkalitolerans TaxID=3104292 RepID=A0ABU5KMI7_9BACL|nr:reverse transcriptase-like protein [Jeotgalibacillus sp. HH7-29]MDZ5711961.1 reverse transcriptase-like protein [Jeotgalibacillus sp. HH7-29]
MIELFIDGASAGDPGLSGAGIFVKNGKDSLQFSIELDEMSNHEAEYEAFLIGLEKCLPYKHQIISCKTDSQAVYAAVEKRYIKNKKYAHYLPRINELLDQFDLFFIKWIPGKENSVADKLARQAIHSQKKKS